MLSLGVMIMFLSWLRVRWRGLFVVFGFLVGVLVLTRGECGGVGGCGVVAFAPLRKWFRRVVD